MSQIVNALHLGTALFAIWFLYFCCWREYKVDAFRQKLFAIRDDVFDFARSGQISFNDPAYVTLRNLINALIRFAHRATFTRVLVLAASNRSLGNPMAVWLKDLERLPPNVRKKFTDAHQQIANATALHVVIWSPFAMLLVAALFLTGLVVKLLRLQVRVVRPPEEISSVLEQEALEQPVEFDECLAVS